MSVLISFVGKRDPYNASFVEGEREPGPILSMLAHRNFDGLVLLATDEGQAGLAQKTLDEAKKHHKKIDAQVRIIKTKDPTSHEAVLTGLRKSLADFINNPNKIFVSISSGTPAMHACWVLLIASGELPATLLAVRERRFVRPDCPAVYEIDVHGPDFPSVQGGRFEISERLDLPSPTEIENALVRVGMVAQSPVMKKAVQKTAGLAIDESITVLLHGESGTGKELFANLIHRLSPRSNGPFIARSCAEITPSLAEGLLFGHAKGAFTGAVSDSKGWFEQADKGTLFLDEIGELGADIQPKLLRVLQDGTVTPVGSRKSIKLDVRVIAATNKDLRLEVKEGRFREDLFFRLHSTVKIPPLRERGPSEIRHLMDYFRNSQKRRILFSKEAMKLLLNHSWPGNVRELESVIKDAVALCPTDVAQPEDFNIMPPFGDKGLFEALPPVYDGFNLIRLIDRIRGYYWKQAWEQSGKHKARAAGLLGMTPVNFGRYFNNFVGEE